MFARVQYLRTNLRESLRRLASIFLYELPLRIKAIRCHADQTVQGTEPHK